MIRHNTIRRSKYGSQKMSFDGRTYDSKKECEYAQQLEWRRRAGEITEVIPQYKLELNMGGVHIANYYVDFKVVFPDGREEMHEVKGFETDVWRIKWRMALAIYGKDKFKLIK
jgi:hypothetical protein